MILNDEQICIVYYKSNYWLMIFIIKQQIILSKRKKFRHHNRTGILIKVDFEFIWLYRVASKWSQKINKEILAIFTKTSKKSHLWVTARSLDDSVRIYEKHSIYRQQVEPEIHEHIDS